MVSDVITLLPKARSTMQQMTITPRHALRVLAAAFLCCTLTQAAVSQTATKRGKQTEQAVEPPPKVESDEARAARGRAKMEKQQKEFDAKAARAAKSICSNC
jgi:hypothetical protein